SELTDQDLEKLGISLGHRKRMLRAIRELSSPPPATAPAAAPAPTETKPPARDSAERRPLTVMFCDLVGSTALSARLDPEDLREVIHSYQACVFSTIQAFKGFIARYVGDGVLIYFVWPEAHETDAARAVQAGLAV